MSGMPGPSGYQSGSSGYQLSTGHDPEPASSGYQLGTAHDPEPASSGYQLGTAHDPEPASSGYQLGTAHDPEPASSGYQLGTAHDPEPASSGYQSGSTHDPEPGSSGYHSGSMLDQEPGPSECQSNRIVDVNLNSYALGSGLPLEPEPGPSGYPGASRYPESVARSTANVQPGPSGYDELVIDESDDINEHDADSYLQVVTESFGQQPVPSNYASFQAGPELQSIESDSREPEPGPSGYDPVSQAGAYRDIKESVNIPDHGSLPDNEPGPSGLNQSRNSPVDDEAPGGYPNEPGPSNYVGNPPIGSVQDQNQLIGLIHGEISNPPSPLGGRVIEADYESDDDEDDDGMSSTDSPHVGPGSVSYFGMPFLPDPVSNPSSPQVGPSSGTSKRRGVPPDSFVFGNNKKSRFEPTPGPSNIPVQRHQSHLNVSR